MIRVIIADDEERVCRLIQALVDWKSLDMEVVGTASNGNEALVLLQKVNPDILITDIRMPGCNGLELIEQAKKICAQLHIMIISGYAHFEYAQSAMRYGVREYLLKPINKDELTAVLIRTKELIEKENITDHKNKAASENFDRLRSMLIQDMLENRRQELNESVLEEQYHMKVIPGFFQALCMKIDCDNNIKTASKEDEADTENLKIKSLAIEKSIKILNSSLAKHCHDWVMLWRNPYIYGILNYQAKEQDNIKRLLADGINQLEAQKNILGVKAFSLGLGGAYKDAAMLGTSTQEAVRAVKDKLIRGTGKLIENSDSRAVLYEKKLLDKYIRDISHALELLSIDDIKAANDDLEKIVVNTPNVQGWEILDLVEAAGEMFIMRLDIQDKTERSLAFKKSCQDCFQISQLFMTLMSFEEKLMDEVIEKRDMDQLRPVRLAKQYIQNHYWEPITLEGVSETVGLSTAYFSALFKKETEVGFAKYLMNIRMEQAKELLRNTSIPVADVCEKVGYHDKKHFTHTFEKVTGLKPAVYRKLYG